MIAERKNTIVVTFVERDVPKPTPYELHEWIYDVFRFEEDELEMIQLNNYTRQVYIQCKEEMTVKRAIMSTNGESTFTHSTGQRSKVTITTAGLGFRIVKLYHLPKDLNPELIRGQLATYGTVISLLMDSWGPTLRYKISNGVRTARMDLKKHIPSYIEIAGFKSFVSYEGQPITCALCNGTGHLRTACPRQRVVTQTPRVIDPPTWSQLVQGEFPIRRVPLTVEKEPVSHSAEGLSITKEQVTVSAASAGNTNVETQSECHLVTEQTTPVSPAIAHDDTTAATTAYMPTLSNTIMVEELSEGESEVSTLAPNEDTQGQHDTEGAPSVTCSAAISRRDPRVKKRRTDSADGVIASGSRKKEKTHTSFQSESDAGTSMS